MAIPTQTLRDLRVFLLSDFVTIKGTQIPLINSFVQALITEEQFAITQQAVKERVSTRHNHPLELPAGLDEGSTPPKEC